MLEPERFLLRGKRAIVTGAAAGIGRGIAVALGRFGADVAVCDRDADGLAGVGAEIDALGRQTLMATMDVRDAGAVGAFVTDVATAFGYVDVLVNNAGGGFQAPFLDVSVKGEAALLAENFTSVTSLVRQVVPLMPETGGSIVNVTSIEAFRGAPGYAIYAAMKAAVESLTRSLALELGPRFVRVNCIAPDVIPTPGIGDPPVTTPLPRRGTVDDVAAAAVYLAGDASAFVTGTTIHVDGGNLAAGGWRQTPDGSWAP